MLSNAVKAIHPWVMQTIGRDWVEYIASNTMNVVTQRVDPFLWTYDCKAKIVDIRQETPDTKTFVLLPNQHFKQPLPGQHIEVAVTSDTLGGKAQSRCYSLSIIDENTVSITVKRNPQGLVSNWLHEHASIGMILNISSPRGAFIYRGQEKLLFISAGAGITPCFSILNALESTAKRPDIAFYYRSRTPEETIFRTQLEGSQVNSTIDISYSRQVEPDDRVNVLPHQLMDAYPDLKDRHIYLCGPDAFKKEVLTYLESIEYDFDNLEVEHFVRFNHDASEIRKLDEDVTVTLKSQNISFVIEAENCDQTILEAAEKKGIHLEHGCRSGMCGTCRTNVVSGQVSGNQLGKTIYPCTAYAASTQLILE